MARDDVLRAAWKNPRFRALPDSARALFDQLVILGPISSAGVLPLMPAKWASGLRDATADSTMSDLGALYASGFVVLDADSFEVLICNFIRDTGVRRNSNHLRGALNAAGEVNSPILRQCLALEVVQLGIPLAAALAESDPRPSRRHIPLSVRRGVYERDGWRCVYCARAFQAVPVGAPVDQEFANWLELDHIKPYSLGGDDTPENLRSACSTCNRRRGVDDADLWADRIGDSDGA